MRQIQLVSLMCCVALFSSESLLGQGRAALPFLLIPPSIEANGMGGISTSVSSNDAIAPLQNAGQLGLFSLHSFLSAGFYAPSTEILPEFNVSGMQYGAWAVNMALQVHDLVDLPFKLGIAAGYSQINMDLGTFSVTGSSGPTVIGTIDAYEKSSALSVGLGFEYVIRAGIGMNFKSIESSLSPFGGEQEQGVAKATPSAHDFGAMAQLPVAGLVTALSGASLEFIPKVRPVLDLGASYARNNIGDEVVYIDPAQADPLPRTAMLGGYVEVGAVSLIPDPEWDLISFILVREAVDLLVTAYPDGTWEYQSGLGDINYVENVIQGKTPANATLRRGWQIQVGEMVYVRGGSVESPERKYETNGYSVRLGGLVKLVMVLSPSLREQGWFRFLADVLDVQYSSATYSGDVPSPQPSFKGFNIVLRKIPFLN